MLTYYVCNVDVSWNNRPDTKNLDLSNEARQVSENNGTFMAGNMGPKLGELYTSLAPYPLECQSHLSAHTALCDSLMLYELIKLGLLKIS